MINRNPASFRDPDGFVFESENAIYRSVHESYSKQYDFLVQSGLLDHLFENRLMVGHREVNLPDFDLPDSYLIVQHETLPLISYPYEWSFSQLKEAALLTLEVQQTALRYGMILKDASAFNVQYDGCRALLIDTLSFDIYAADQAWLGYRQFCEHFLGPLCLASFLGASFQMISWTKLDGLPLHIASRLLPWRSWLVPSVLFHIHMHAIAIRRHASGGADAAHRENVIPKTDLLAMVDHLKHFIGGLSLRNSDRTIWKDYHLRSHYGEAALKAKTDIVRQFVGRVRPGVVWDLGANDGFFSRAIADQCARVISLDADPIATDRNFNMTKEAKIENVYPLLYDLANPSPDLGWSGHERLQLRARSAPHLLLALALLHHLVVTNNIPFAQIAEYFAGLADWLIIEFVPYEDEKFSDLPNSGGRKQYSRGNFEQGFFRYFELIDERTITDSKRTILLLKKRAN